MNAAVKPTTEQMNAARTLLCSARKLHVDSGFDIDASDVAGVLAEREAALRVELQETTAERDRLRKLFDDAGQGEHNVLALVEHWQQQALAGDAACARELVLIDAVKALREGIQDIFDTDFGDLYEGKIAAEAMKATAHLVPPELSSSEWQIVKRLRAVAEAGLMSSLASTMKTAHPLRRTAIKNAAQDIADMVAHRLLSGSRYTVSVSRAGVTLAATVMTDLNFAVRFRLGGAEELEGGFKAIDPLRQLTQGEKSASAREIAVEIITTSNEVLT